MEKEVWWTSLEETGLERLRLIETDTGVIAEGLILRVFETVPHQIDYRIRCDAQWRVREAKVVLKSVESRRIKIRSDGKGNWTNEKGERLAQFEGCFDIDISATPFTNTLPLRRRALGRENDSADIAVVYFLIPEMTLQRSRQRYEFMKKGVVRFEERGIFDRFSADLRIDETGLVVEYPQLFKRLR